MKHFLRNHVWIAVGLLTAAVVGLLAWRYEALVGLTAALAIATFAYVLITYRLLLVTRQQALLASNPALGIRLASAWVNGREGDRWAIGTRRELVIVVGVRNLATEPAISILAQAKLVVPASEGHAAKSEVGRQYVETPFLAAGDETPCDSQLRDECGRTALVFHEDVTDSLLVSLENHRVSAACNRGSDRKLPCLEVKTLYRNILGQDYESTLELEVETLPRDAPVVLEPNESLHLWTAAGSSRRYRSRPLPAGQASKARRAIVG